MAEAKPQDAAPRLLHSPLWRDLRGKTSFRVFGALILDELCQKPSTAELLRQLRKRLRRSLSRQSLAAWRRGDLATPNDVMLATAAIVRRTLADASIQVVMRVLADPEADPIFAEGLRVYYAHGRPEVPADDSTRWLITGTDEARRRRRASRVELIPLWQNPRGKTSYRIFGALCFDELCEKTDLGMEELLRRLRRELHRPLSRQTLASWRRGDQSVPSDVMLATGAIVRRTLAEASVVVVMRVLSDPDADPRFVEMLRIYLGQDGDT